MTKKNKNSRKTKKRTPRFLGKPILARKNPDKGFVEGNIYWRSAVSQEEADEMFEIHVGKDLKRRFLELEAAGYIKLIRPKFNRDFGPDDE